MKKRIKKLRKINSKYENEDALRSYLRDINKVPLLNREEEEKLARETANGSKAARDRLINANLRFVVKIAKRYQGQGLPLSDLISEGNIGLIRAAGNYDADRGFHFISYAVWWIRQSIIMAIIEKARVIRLPVMWNKKLYQILNDQQKSTDTQSDSINNINPENKYSMSDENFKRLMMLGQDVLSLEQPVSDNDSTISLGDFLTNENELSPEENAINVSLHDEIVKLINTLDSKEAEIIAARYGIKDQQPKSLEEIGDRLQISKEGIRQIENRAIKHLRESEMKNRLSTYVA